MEEKLKIDVNAGEDIKGYYRKISKRCEEQLQLAQQARSLGLDIRDTVETSPALDLADRTEKIIGPRGIAKRFREAIVEENGDRLEAIFKIFREIIEEKWVKIPNRQRRLEQAVKTALMLVTEAVVVAPLDGVPSVKISENFDGSEYVNIYFAGPIRAAGGTATVFPLILADYARKLMDLDRYKPTDAEIERYVEEAQIYDEIFTRQYKLGAEEVRHIIKNCSMCINGEPTEKREVVAYKNLDRIPTNRVRGGACLVISEGIALKAMKIMQYAKKLDLDWGWLEKIVKVSKASDSTEMEPNWKYLSNIAAGRPIFCYPSRIGGFRLRYGKCRNSGIMAKAVHPATMYLLDEFIAVGTQLKVERPGKSAGMLPCDTIDGPIVKLKDGEVRKIETAEEAKSIQNQLEEILFLGDYLVSYGDFRHSGHPLVPVGYCEEWWKLELEKTIMEKKPEDIGINLNAVLKNPAGIDGFTAVELSMQLGVPLHPKFLHYYAALTIDELLHLMEKTRKAKKIFDETKIVGAELENTAELKKLFEKIGLPHKIKDSSIVVDSEHAYPFLKTVGALSDEAIVKEDTILSTLTKISGIGIRDKCGTFIGARMGRPEQAKPRKMTGSPHILFPIGLYGGNTRSINKAMEATAKGLGKGEIEVEIAQYKCADCGKLVPYNHCPFCNGKAVIVDGGGSKTKIDLGGLMLAATESLRMKLPDPVKGVKGLINDGKIAEPLEKGILRAYYDLHVFRDSTIRYEMLNAPLTHFKPKEIGISVEKLKELGYKKDIHGKGIASVEQMIELFPQDVIINEDAGDFFVRVTKFVDDLLEKYYGLRAYHKINSKEELVGEMLLGLAPHTSAALVVRLLGFTKARVNFGHPFSHLARRRNADGEQDSFMLLSDVLLNFSLEYLSSSRGGRMDAPLVFTVALNPEEIDDEAYDMEICSSYPLELYENCQKMVPAEIDSVKRVWHVLGTKQQYRGFGFTHDTSVFDAGPTRSMYVRLDTMEKKMNAQARVQSMIRAVDKKDALERVLVSHFLPDILGNARSFSKQTFRCTNCNTIYRRVPLSGKCNKCNGGNIVLTIAQGSVRKYLDLTKNIINKYGLSDYLKQRIQLIEQEVDSIFSNERSTQKSLSEFV